MQQSCIFSPSMNSGEGGEVTNSWKFNDFFYQSNSLMPQWDKGNFLCFCSRKKITWLAHRVSIFLYMYIDMLYTSIYRVDWALRDRNQACAAEGEVLQLWSMSVSLAIISLVILFPALLQEFWRGTKWPMRYWKRNNIGHGYSISPSTAHAWFPIVIRDVQSILYVNGYIDIHI